jgi:hypothetical protein
MSWHALCSSSAQGEDEMWVWMSAAAFAGTTSWVVGDVVNVRADTDASAEAVARLPIGTMLRAGESRDGWTWVQLANRPDDHAISGWVRSDLLVPEPPTVEGLLARADAQAFADERASWEGRARSLDPWHPLVVERFGAPPDPIELAICDGERVWHVGSWGDEGITPSGLRDDGSFVGQDALEKQARILGARTWYAHEWAHHGTFATPFVASQAATEDDGERWGPRQAQEGDTQIVLGACEAWQEGHFYATAPLSPQATRPIGAAKLAKVAHGRPEDVSGVIAVRPDLPGELVEVVTLELTPRRSCGESIEDAKLVTGAFWTLLDAQGAAVEPFLVNIDGSVQPGLGLVAWYGTPRGTLGAVLGHDGLTQVTSLVRVGPSGQAAVDHVVLRYFGC